MYISSISPLEVHHEQALQLMRSIPEEQPFVVPSLFRLEVVSALARRGELKELLETVKVLVHGPRFHTVPLSEALLENAQEVAEVAGLRAYDAVYVALARETKAQLLTFDREVRTRVSRHFPEVSLGESETA